MTEVETQKFSEIVQHFISERLEQTAHLKWRGGFARSFYYTLGYICGFDSKRFVTFSPQPMATTTFCH